MLNKLRGVESATGDGVLYVGHSNNGTSKREIPLNGAAREVFKTLNPADKLGPYGAHALDLEREPAPLLRPSTSR